jgi:hypothetical protein
MNLPVQIKNNEVGDEKVSGFCSTSVVDQAGSNNKQSKENNSAQKVSGIVRFT